MDSSSWRDQFDEKLKRKYDIKQQEVDVSRAEQLAKAPYYAGAGAHYAGANESAERVAGMHYGPDGAVDRQIANQKYGMNKQFEGQALHYGPGGAMDRDIAALAVPRSEQARYYGAQADYNKEKAGEVNITNELLKRKINSPVVATSASSLATQKSLPWYMQRREKVVKPNWNLWDIGSY